MPDTPVDEQFSATVTCAGCGREVPNGTIYCPWCCGETGHLAAVLRGAWVGALAGVVMGVMIAVAWSMVLGPERATWGRGLGVVVACATTGLMWGMVRKRK